MGSEVVIVTSWQREELLFLCLEAIRREDWAIGVFVYSDRGATSLDLEKTCETFKAKLLVREPHTNYGNSFNLLMACSAQLDGKSPDIVHLIEDDPLIHKGYLRWAREQLTVLKSEPGKHFGAYLKQRLL